VCGSKGYRKTPPEEPTDMQHYQPTTIAILGTDTLSERILALLLEDEGYDTRHLEAHSSYPIDKRLDGADVLLLSLREKGYGHTSYPRDMRSVLEKAASIPLLSLSPTLEVALLDEQAVSVPWQEHFEQLLRQIEAALKRPLSRDQVSRPT
jgi:hypothetical protein